MSQISLLQVQFLSELYKNKKELYMLVLESSSSSSIKLLNTGPIGPFAAELEALASSLFFFFFYCH